MSTSMIFVLDASLFDLMYYSHTVETPRNRSHSAPPTRGGRTGHDLWMNAVKNRQTCKCGQFQTNYIPKHLRMHEYFHEKKCITLN